MTINYSGSFLKLLFRWKGSVWKAVWKEFIIFIIIYYVIRLIMKLLDFSPQVDKDQTDVVKLFQEYTLRIPLEFLVSFYVSQVVARWWSQVQTMPWPDDCVALFNAFLPDGNDLTRLKRLTMTRYLILSFVIALRQISSSILKTVPTLTALTHSGLLTFSEMDELEKMPEKKFQWELPLQWIQELARSQVGSDNNQIPLGTMGTFVAELNKIRSSFRQLFSYHTICLPLVYTQTATVVVYGFFLFSLIGYQYYSKSTDIIVPCLIILRFIVCVGWLKVAEDLWKPFGKDDEDVELLLWLDRHIRFAFTVSNYSQKNSPTFETDDTNLDRLLSIFNVNAEKKDIQHALGRLTSQMPSFVDVPSPLVETATRRRRQSLF